MLGQSAIQNPRSTIELPLLAGHLLTNSIFLLSQFWRELVAEVGCFKHLTNLNFFIIIERSALQPLDRLFFRLHLPEPEAGNELLCFRERTIGDRRLSV